MLICFPAIQRNHFLPRLFEFGVDGRVQLRPQNLYRLVQSSVTFPDFPEFMI